MSDTEIKRKPGRPPHQPTDQTRKQVESLVGFGLTEKQIATVMGISQPTLDKHYAHEMATGQTKANAQVANSLYRKATGDGAQSVAAAIFWLKTRAGWKETIRVENENIPTDVADRPLTEEEWAAQLALPPPDRRIQ